MKKLLADTETHFVTILTDHLIKQFDSNSINTEFFIY